MFRREFIERLVLSPILRALPKTGGSSGSSDTSSIHGVLGPLSGEELGITLIHEHVLVDFIGADKVSRNRYDAEEAFRTVLPRLKEAYESGCRTLVECTPAYIGRDPVLLTKLSQASGLHLITNTGYYGAANDKFLPQHAFAESADQLARRWIREFGSGIDDTGIKPGIIKIGVDPGPLSPIDAKLVRAAARTHLETGLTIASHTGDATAALEQLDLLREYGVAASAFIWVHAQNETKLEKHFEAARRGAWVEFDGIAEKSLQWHVQLVQEMSRRGFLDRTLISQDAGWYHVGESAGGAFRSYDFLFTRFLPALKSAGIADKQIRVLLVENPKRVLTPAIRKT
jgi:predicted metal-dependent phosphotriesterase family hydrolase